MEKSYKFRMYPSKQQESLLNSVVNSCRFLYNHQLEYERYVYEKGQRFANRVELDNLLPDIKVINQNLKSVYSQVLQNVNDRVIKAFEGFFGRVKQGSVGYPRFKGRDRYNSFTYPQSGFKFASQSKLCLSKIGELSINLHRAIKGKVKTLTILKTPTNKWFACFSVQQDISPIKRSSNRAIGIDLGLNKFATLSDGNVIDNPRNLEKSLKRLQFLSRRLSRKSKGSKNKLKARVRLARLYEKVVNQRLDFLHKSTRKLVRGYDCIALEGLKVSSMENKYLQFSINDASWNKFRQLLIYKAEEAGCELDFVEPRGTSKRCSKCGGMADMPLSKRVYECSCGNSMLRDLNSAFNILQASRFFHTVGQTGINACGVVPMGTTMNQEAPCFR